MSDSAVPETDYRGTERFDLTGKAALITGSSRGLGKAMALGFAAAGAEVIVSSRRLDTCEQVVAEITAKGGTATALRCHVGHWAELDDVVDAAFGAFGHLDVLVNNAGMSPVYGSVDQVDEALWDKVLDVNLKGVFRLSALVGTRMAAGSGGSIINVSSTGSIRPTPWILPYAAAKAGVNALTVGFARTFGPKVRVNCIMPGPFITDITAGWDMERFERDAKARFALQRGGRPDEIVGTALYLASDASSFTTGAIVRVDGGIP